MTIYDKTEMVGRTNIEQMNKLFNMGSELESLVEGNSGDITAIELDIDDIQGDIADIEDELEDKQDTLVSGTNIKTINGNTILGSGNLDVVTDIDDELSDISTNPVENRVIKDALDYKQDTLVSGSNIKTVNGNTLLGSGDLSVLTSVTWDDVTGKPTFSTVATTGDYYDLINKPEFATVATTGDYDDLTDKPVIFVNTVGSSQPATGKIGDIWYDNSANDFYICTADTPSVVWTKLVSGSGAVVDWSDVQNKPSFATVATTGDYDDLTNKPSIPDAQVQSDWSQSDSSAVDYIKNKPVIPSAVTVDSALDSTSENPVQNKVINTALETKADTSSLATVATSGSYTDLSNKPTIPTVTTGTITLTVAGWSSNTQTVTVSGYDSTKPIIMSPALASYVEYVNCEVYVSAESGTSVTFTCTTVPENALTVEWVMFS